MTKIKKIKPKASESFFEKYFNWLWKNGNSKVFHSSSMDKRAQKEILILEETRRSKKVSKEEMNYIFKLHDFIKKTWDGTEYSLKDTEIKPIKKIFDNEWLKAKKKIPLEYIGKD